ncbi:MAG: hypothetical protein A3I32_01720 [Candidatus Yanofskybacteria bacterium RIFCSPLOWO2_02_FULL_45_10]|uniref:Prepilin peptidase n=2 Tax=Candidatus Yanofskyibacteriota TaxID=1752733 RepID=A0A1F8G1Z7_9BACT|nr:MAG: hypothetical protein A3F25_01410 [Candidatus Yanofskybacteria bacterium RIFCSPHIGHO2_12_FULL_45_19b]OGN32095.1 MAG: hypothetical protein A3I32_01720 [Candidatus Yanofskybacteria bacterium RIFCSPLOWO2_02_FULL_45_10]
MLTVVLFLVGLIVGSFLNVVIWRLPRGEGVTGLVRGEKKGQVSTERQFRYWDNSRSKCPNCQRQINWYDLMPVISFFILRRRCRFCKKPISWRYPLIELSIGLLALLLYWLFLPVSLIQWLNFAYWLVTLSGVFAIGVIDFTHLVIPDKILIVLGVVGLAHAIKFDFSSHLITALIGGVLFALVYWITHGRGIGWGDVKFIFVLGLLFGFPDILFVIYGALFLGVIWGGALLLTRRANMKTKLPFGTMLATTAILTIFLHSWLISSTSEYLFYLYH